MMIKCCCSDFVVGMAAGFVAGMMTEWMLHPKHHRMKTGAGRAMEEVSGKVDDAFHRIQCAMR